VVAGEILESLWSSLNSISPTARMATLVHRAEMLDDHTCDSNHKKTLSIITSLSKAHRTAVDMLEHAKTYHRNLSNDAGPQAVEKWKKDVEEAEKMRSEDITAMDVYAAKKSTLALGGGVAAGGPTVRGLSVPFYGPNLRLVASALSRASVGLPVDFRRVTDRFLTLCDPLGYLSYICLFAITIGDGCIYTIIFPLIQERAHNCTRKLPIYRVWFIVSA